MLQGGILQHLQQKGMSQKDTTAFGQPGHP